MSVKFQYGTQADYDSLENFDSNCIYFITDTQRIYKGNTLYASADIKDIRVNGESVKTGEIVDISVPTKTSQLENDRNYITANNVPSEIQIGGEEPTDSSVVLWFDENDSGYIVQYPDGDNIKYGTEVVGNE